MGVKEVLESLGFFWGMGAKTLSLARDQATLTRQTSLTNTVAYVTPLQQQASVCWYRA